jgi:hypothetical protein
MKIRYTAKLLVLRQDGVMNTIYSGFEGKSKEAIIEDVKEAVEEGENLKGGIVAITEETGVEFEGDEYIKTKKYLDFVGDLTQDEMDKLQTKYFQYLENQK